MFPEERLAYYEKGLRIDPSDGVIWVQLGLMSRAGDPERALQAFYNACIHGDPGVNGCYNAGRMAEKLGDIQGAIAYYRLSTYWKAQQRADELVLENYEK